ncbi:DUF934 domain-containing protein [Aurantivibrio infirmus]
MPKLIKDASIVEDEWQFIEFEADKQQNTLPAGKIILPLDIYLAQADQASSRQQEIGVWINGDEDLNKLTSHLSTIPLIAVRFPGFMDGRSFSTGRLLRDRYQFGGELRAIGSFIRDQLCYLNRCGFNAFSFALSPDAEKEEANLESALNSLNDFQEYYQASSNQPLPLFRRRA